MKFLTMGSCNTRFMVNRFLKEQVSPDTVDSFLDVNTSSSEEFLNRLMNVSLDDGDVYIVDASPYDIHTKDIELIWRRILLVLQSKAPNSKIVNINFFRIGGIHNHDLVNSISEKKRAMSNGINFFNIDVNTTDSTYYCEDLCHYKDVKKLYSELVKPEMDKIIDKLRLKIYEHKIYNGESIDVIDPKGEGYKYNKYIVRCNEEKFTTINHMVDGMFKKEFIPYKTFWGGGLYKFEVDGEQLVKMEISRKLPLVESYHYQYDPDKYVIK